MSLIIIRGEFLILTSIFIHTKLKLLNAVKRFNRGDY